MKKLEHINSENYLMYSLSWCIGIMSIPHMLTVSDKIGLLI